MIAKFRPGRGRRVKVAPARRPGPKFNVLNVRDYCALLAFGAGVTGGAGFAGAGLAGIGLVVAGLVVVGGAIDIAGGRASLEAVLVPFWPGWCPMPNTTAKTIATNTAAAIQPQAELPVRTLGSYAVSRWNGSSGLR